MYVVPASRRGAVYHAFDTLTHAFARTEEHPTLCGRRLPAAAGTRGWMLSASQPLWGARLCDRCYRVIVEDRGPE